MSKATLPKRLTVVTVVILQPFSHSSLGKMISPRGEFIGALQQCKVSLSWVLVSGSKAACSLVGFLMDFHYLWLREKLSRALDVYTALELKFEVQFCAHVHFLEGIFLCHCLVLVAVQFVLSRT